MFSAKQAVYCEVQELLQNSGVWGKKGWGQHVKQAFEDLGLSGLSARQMAAVGSLVANALAAATQADQKMSYDQIVEHVWDSCRNRKGASK